MEKQLDIYDRQGNIVVDPDLKAGHIMKYHEFNPETGKIELMRLVYEEGAPEYPEPDENDPAVLRQKIDELTQELNDVVLLAAEMAGNLEDM